MKKAQKWLVVGFLCLLLLLIRGYEDVLFYDPLLEYFKSDYKNFPLPEMNLVKLSLHIGFRFLLNSLISLGILWVIFKDSEVIKLSVWIYGFLFFLLFSAFFLVIYFSEGVQNQLSVFYIRRFLIQPILLLILLAAFYFQKKNIQ